MDIRRSLLRGLILALAVVAPLLARAEGDPPGRVGRLADMQGHVWLYDPDQGEWLAADRNRPLTTGDRLATDADARAELRIGSTTLRVGAGSELELLRLDDERLSFQLHQGTLALRLRSREVAAQTDVVTDEVRLQPLSGGHFRIDRVDDSTFAGSWRGELRAGDGAEAFAIRSGQRFEVWREGVRGVLQSQADAMPRDEFATWVAGADASDERSAAMRYVSPEMTGAEDLDANGRWEQAPDIGPVWAPYGVAADWAPYRYGHWAWIAPWGWTWIDDAPWGFAPFHYGRWVHWRDHWCWSPGAYEPRPVYAPALVAWIGGANFSVSVGIGGALLPALGWVPLAPREPFVPYYRASRGYEDRINHGPRSGRGPSRPGIYVNQAVPGALTVVPREVIEHRRPVAPARVEGVVPPQQSRPIPGVAPLPPPVRPPTGPRPASPPSGARPEWHRPLPAPGGASPGEPSAPPRRPGGDSRPDVPHAGERGQVPQLPFFRPTDRPAETPRDEPARNAPSLPTAPGAVVRPQPPRPDAQSQQRAAGGQSGPGSAASEERAAPPAAAPSRPMPESRPSLLQQVIPARPQAPQPPPQRPAPAPPTPAVPVPERSIPERHAPEGRRPERPVQATPPPANAAPERAVPARPVPATGAPVAGPRVPPASAPPRSGGPDGAKPAPAAKDAPAERRRIPDPAEKPGARE